MPIPQVDNAHAAEGQALLTTHYRSAAVVSGLLKSFLQRVQTEEDSLWSLINGVQLANHPMGGGPWSILDQIGEIVGCPRQGRTDADYLAAIKIQVRVNRSRGLAEDIIQIAALVLTGGRYVEWPPAAFEMIFIESITVPAIKALIQYLGTAKSAGTSGYIRSAGTANSPPQMITWGSTVGTATHAAGFSDSVSHLPANTLASLMRI